MNDHPWGRRGDRDLLRRIAKDSGYSADGFGRLEQAFTHKSFSNESLGAVPHNERLEFLGDAILDLIVAEALMGHHPDAPEGELSRWRASLVSTRSLAEVARGLGLGGVLLLGRGEQRSGGRRKNSLLADAYEAMIGAIYLDHGLEAVRLVILRHLGTRLVETPSYRDFKTVLQEWSQKHRNARPVYRVVSETGPDHEKTFEVEVVLQEKVLAKAEGSSKKMAERRAAELALGTLSADEDGGMREDKASEL